MYVSLFIGMCSLTTHLYYTDLQKHVDTSFYLLYLLKKLSSILQAKNETNNAHYKINSRDLCTKTGKCRAVNQQQPASIYYKISYI
ncbi:hypothetical protein GDO86_014219 [Hymenochirus boettgeri]|uniref:Uncharacterized protein n=1 Tax=Hymenochirus boettgeri TaxID=247094 RepID=A0A8T2JTD2_9PIPI|nr:hypothetical protein GDO86_014219 [Hymenochirus boettgeri]